MDLVTLLGNCQNPGEPYLTFEAISVPCRCALFTMLRRDHVCIMSSFARPTFIMLLHLFQAMSSFFQFPRE